MLDQATIIAREALLSKATMVAAAILALCDFASAQDAGRGRAIAQQRCAMCHNIDGGPRGRGRSAPAFSEIARQQSFNANQLAVTLAYNHIPMGNGRVTAGEAGDVAAYIVSLRRR
ncbi:MAG: c-type cytochrome [Proteobacteria bacterium]|nr:c-type cytochrome [Pseudomonadota bacterium]